MPGNDINGQSDHQREILRSVKSLYSCIAIAFEGKTSLDRAPGSVYYYGTQLQVDQIGHVPLH